MRRSTFAVVVILLLAGCSSNSIIGHRLDNFTARYNAFYNAERAFRTGVKAVEKPDERIDRTTYLPIFPKAQGGSVPDFANAIKKSADVLRKHPSSKWVDDALLLIGKSYFYQQNYVGAEQKFREVMTLPTRLDGEARFWLARTLVASGSYDAAAEHLNVSLASDDLSPRWEPLMRLSLAELHVKLGQWDEAAEALTQGLERVRENDVRARAQFLLGQVYETMGRYEEAVRAFETVERFKPHYELSYAAQLSAARVMGMHVNPDAALQRLRRMERDDKHYNNLAEVIFVRGQVLQAAGRPQHALTTYREVLYGNAEYNVQLIRGRVHYAMAELYRDAYEDFITAAAHFDTASTTIGQAGTDFGLAGTNGDAFAFTKEAITDSKEQAETFGNFARVMREVVRMDSLLWLGSLDDAAFEEAVLEMRKRRAEELAAQQRALDQRELEQGFRNAVTDASREREGGMLSTSTGGASFLFHQEPARVQEGRLIFIERWGDRPLVPNWRRMAAITAVAVSSPQQGGDSTGTPAVSRRAVQQAQREAELPQVDISGVPRDPESRRRVMKDRALSRYELGNVLFLSMNRPDSAATWYRMVVEEDSSEAVAQRAYYALAEVHRALGDTLAANQIYRDILARYPTSDFANLVRERLGMGVVEHTGVDSLAIADAAYARAYEAWKAGRHLESIREMMDVAARYAATPVAPRALFAAASAYTEWVRRRDADLLGAMPVQIPDSTLDALGIVPQVMPGRGTTVLTPDALIAPDSIRQMIADSLEAQEHLDVAAQDSLAAPAGEVVPVSGTIPDARPEPTVGVALDAIYAAITQRYPESPYADPAQRVLNVLDERRKERAAADSAEAAARAVPDGTVLPDSAAAAVGAVPVTGGEAADAVEAAGDGVGTQAASGATPEDAEIPVVIPSPTGVDSVRVDSTHVNPPPNEAPAPEGTVPRVLVK